MEVSDDVIDLKVKRDGGGRGRDEHEDRVGEDEKGTRKSKKRSEEKADGTDGEAARRQKKKLDGEERMSLERGRKRRLKIDMERDGEAHE